MRKLLPILWVLVFVISLGQLAARSPTINRKVSAKDDSRVPNVSVTVEGAGTDPNIVADGTKYLHVPG